MARIFQISCRLFFSQSIIFLFLVIFVLSLASFLCSTEIFHFYLSPAKYFGVGLYVFVAARYFRECESLADLS